MARAKDWLWRALPLGLVLGPIAAGLAETARRADLAALAAHPGLGRAMALSLGPGLLATLIACALVILALAQRSRIPLPLLLALPHAALALGLAFLIAPSGLIARLLAPLMGWEAPPDLLTLQDRWGIGLTLGLVIKETPFLLFLALAARSPAITRRVEVAATLGLPPLARVIAVEWPALYPSLRLPILAVLAYGMTTVDMGAILGPGLPAPLSVEVTWAALRPDLGGEGLAAALGLLQLALTGAALGIWRGIEALAARLTRDRRPGGAVLQVVAKGGLGLLVLLPAAALGILVLLAFSRRWPFPELIPQLAAPTLPGLGPLLLTTMTLGLVTAVLAVALALLALQARPGRVEALIWLPLLLPQVAFLPGLVSVLLPLGLGAWPMTLLGHLVLVFPYVWLTLAGPWRALPPGLDLAARTLGAGGPQVFALRLGLMRRALAASLAIGLAASVGQYLATLLLSGGRIATLTTEALALASGPDRARVAALGLAQAALPLLAFALAARVPAFTSRAFPSRAFPLRAFPSRTQGRKRMP